MATKPSPSAGFTLLELAIVLTVIGLIVGGVVGGQALIRNAGMKGIVNDYGRYVRAVNQFKSQYKALPGDFVDATEVWGIAGGTGSDATCATTLSVDQKTCNGNGDGYIRECSGACIAAYGSAQPIHENMRFWQHLANAGYIKGSYSGSAGGGNVAAAYNGGNPSASIPSVYWGEWDWGPIVPTSSYFAVTYGSFLWVGTAGSSMLGSAVFTPKEAFSIDSKIDDGRPGRGSVIGYNVSNCTTASAYNDLSGSYKLTSPLIACNLFFRNLFGN